VESQSGAASPNGGGQTPVEARGGYDRGRSMPPPTTTPLATSTPTGAFAKVDGRPVGYLSDGRPVWSEVTLGQRVGSGGKGGGSGRGSLAWNILNSSRSVASMMNSSPIGNYSKFIIPILQGTDYSQPDEVLSHPIL